MTAVRKKRISKKTRSAWRKTDIQDVEDFLDEQRQEERIGSFVDTKDEDLFTVDVVSRPATLTPKQKRKLAAKKPLRSLEALKNTSKVQDPIVKRNTVKQKKAGRNLEEEVRNPTRPRHFQANKDRENYYKVLDKKLRKDGKELRTAKDIWEERDFRDDIPGLKDEKGWITRDLSLYHAKNLGKPVIKVHSSIRHRTTKAKNFQAPDPGISYNPALEDYHKLIETVAEREEKIIKEEKHLKRVTTRMFAKVTPEEREALRQKEMSAGLDLEEDETEAAKNEKETPVEEDTKEDMDGEYKAINSPVENKKRSKQSRRKELLQKELQKKQAVKKALKKQVADLNRIKSLKAEVLGEEEDLNDLKKRRKKTALKKKFEPKRLARLKFVEPDVDVNMVEDISGNLRNVKTESSLLVDRFKSFQRRNILPTSVATGKQRAKKIKRFTRNTHKDPGVSFQQLRDERREKTLKGLV